MRLKRKEKKELCDLLSVTTFSRVKSAYSEFIALYKQLDEIKRLSIKNMIKKFFSTKDKEFINGLIVIATLCKSESLKEDSIDSLGRIYIHGYFHLAKGLSNQFIELLEKSKATEEIIQFNQKISLFNKYAKDYLFWYQQEYQNKEIQESLVQLSCDKLIDYEQSILKNKHIKDSGSLVKLLKELSAEELNDLPVEQFYIYLTTISQHKNKNYARLFKHIKKYSLNRQLLIIDVLESLTEDELEYLLNDEEEIEKVKEDIIKCSAENPSISYVDIIKALPVGDEYRGLREQIIFEKTRFTELSAVDKINILNRYRENNNINSILDYLINSNFLEIEDSDDLGQILFFLDESNPDVLEEKIGILKDLEEELLEDKKKESNHSEEYIFTYLDLIEKIINNKNAKEQIKYLKVYRTLLEGKNKSQLMSQIANSTKKEDLENLLGSTMKKKKTKQNIKFIKYIDHFSDVVQEEIIERLLNSQNGENSKQIISEVCNPTFISLSIEEQLKRMKTLPGDKKVIEEGVTIDLPDYSYLESKIDNYQGKELTFKNKETGLVVKVKSRKNGKKD